MASDLHDKLLTSVVDHLLKSPGLVLAAVAAYGMAFSSWFGSIVLTGFFLAHKVDPPNLKIVQEHEPSLLVNLSRSVLNTFLEIFSSPGTSLLFILIFLGGIYLLILHVLFKERIHAQEPNDLPKVFRKVFVIYQRGYYGIALGTLVLLTLLVLGSTTPALVFMSATLLAPFVIALTYVHATTVTRGTLGDRSLYIFGLVVLVIIVLLFPNHYGRHFFDTQIAIPAEVNGHKARTANSVIFKFIGFERIGGKYYSKEGRKFIEFIHVTDWKFVEDVPSGSPFAETYPRLRELLRNAPPKPMEKNDDEIQRALEALKH